MCMYMHVCVCLHIGQRLMSVVLFDPCLPHILRQSLSFKPGLIEPANLTSQLVPGILCLSGESWDDEWILQHLHQFWDLNWSPPTGTKSTLLTVLSQHIFLLTSISELPPSFLHYSLKNLLACSSKRPVSNHVHSAAQSCCAVLSYRRIH